MALLALQRNQSSPNPEQFQHHLCDVRLCPVGRTPGFHLLFSQNTRQTPLGQPITPLSLCLPESSQQKMFKDIDTLPVSVFPLAPWAFLAPVRVRVKELTGNQHSQRSSFFCLFETCHFLTSSAYFSWGTISPHSPFHSPHDFISLCCTSLHFLLFQPEPFRNFEPPYCFSLNLFSLCFILPGIREG